jgi:glycosidase
MTWPGQPSIYEINTWVWLDDLGRRRGAPTTLGTVPPEEWNAVADLAVDAVWLMGVWQRSPAGVEVARALPNLVREYRRALPDYTPADVVGSPYSVRDYVVDERLGGPEGLAAAREALARRGVRLLLDYVPNHVARDHPWVTAHPERLVGGSLGDLVHRPDEFFEANGRVIAFGRDPNYPPWTDTAQLNAFHPGLRQAAVDTLGAIAGQSDGVRCDRTSTSGRR